MKIMNSFLPGILLSGILILSGCEKGTETAGAGDPAADGGDVVSVESPDPNAGGMAVEPAGGDLEQIRFLKITFPTEMVAQEDVGQATLTPVTVEPAARCAFKWTSTSGGILETTTTGYSDVMRRLRLAPDLKDFAGNPIHVKGWGADFANSDFSILNVSFLDSDGELFPPNPNFHLGGMQQVAVSFSRDVLPSKIAGSLAFVDAETQERYPVRVAVEQEQEGEPQGVVIVEPAKGLPEGRDFWLVVERTDDYTGSYPMPHLRVYPAGRTSALELTWSRSYNQPRTGRFIRLGFNKPVDLATLKKDAVTIDPPVEISKIEEENATVVLYGDFKPDTAYEVTVPAGITSKDGSKMVGEKSLTMQIPLRRPAIVLDSGRLSVPVGAFDLDVGLCRMEDVTWQIAKIPGESYGAVRDRLKEFANFARNDEGDVILDPRDETVRYVDTDFLIPSMDFDILENGTLDAAAGEELEGRKIPWPSNSMAAGVYLVEFRGRDVDGREVGNRCLVNMKDWMIRNYAGSADSYVHVARIADGSPLVGAEIIAFPHAEDAKPVKLVADANGFVSTKGVDVRYLEIRHDGDSAIQELESETRADAYFDGEPARPSVILFTDGDVFRPGEKVRFSGTLRRLDDNGNLALPETKAAELKIFGDSIGGGDAGFFPPGATPNQMELTMDDSGMVGGEFFIPPGTLSGKYELILESPDDRWNPVQGRVVLTITDFRTPDVNLSIDAPDLIGGTAEMTVSSQYFHGAPQAGAKVKWRAEWLTRDWAAPSDEEEENPWMYYEFSDRYSPAASHQGVEGILGALRAKAADVFIDETVATPVSAIDRGEGVLNKDGVLVVTSECPFNAETRGHRAQVFWVVEVQDESGEVNRTVATQGLQFADRILAMELVDNSDGSLKVKTAALTSAHEAGGAFPVGVEVLHRKVNFTREAIGEKLVRYRNTPVFESVFKGEMMANASLDVPVGKPGDYVVIGTPKDMPGATVVSAQMIGFEGESDGPVLDDLSAEAIPDKAEWSVGEEASIQIRTPVAGWAQVTVETDRLLDVLPPVELKGTAGRISVPVKAGYFPNCYVRVHIQKDGQDGGRPAERLALCELRIRDPKLELKVVPVLAATSVRPRETVEASVRVAALGKPVAGAKVVVGVIDEALLSLGDWKLPDPIAALYPRRPHVFKTGRAVDATWYRFKDPSLGQSQKGFIIGGGGSGNLGNKVFVRENGNPKPFWQGEGVTGVDGTFPFAFDVSDQLTSYRVFAYAVSGPEAAGCGQAKLRVTQPLRLKPFLPRFLREGDRMELRCRIECDASLSEGAVVDLLVDGGEFLRPESGGLDKIRVEPGQSKVVSIPARVEEMSAGKDAVVSFTTRSADGSGDAVKIRIPVKSAYIERTEHRGGALAEADSLSSETVLEGVSSSSSADCDLFISGTRWMPKLVGMASKERPAATVADLSGSALGALLVASMDGYLPSSLSQRASAGRTFQEVMEKLERSVISDAGFGWLPRWPDGDVPDGATTAMVAMAVDFAEREFGELAPEDERLNLQVPWRLKDTLNMWSRTMLGASPSIFTGTPPSGFEKCVALALEAKGESWVEVARLKAVARDLYDHREELDLESKCFLAMADARLKQRESEPVLALSDGESRTLLSEIEKQDAPAEFNPSTLGSRARTEAIRLYAVSILRQGMGEASREEIERLLEPVLKGSLDLNAQENIWILLAARGAVGVESPAALSDRIDASIDPEISPNDVTLAWLGHPASELRGLLSEPIRPGVGSEWLVRITHSEPVATPKGGEGLDLSRKFTNLTEPKRTGNSAAPFTIGDYVLLEYEMDVTNDAYHVELAEHLPAGLEMVNPDLPSVQRNFPVPPVDENETAGLSHVDRRMDRMLLYFEHLAPGTRKYAVLTKVVGAGEFHWPAASAVPMYDKRVQASTVDSMIHSSAGE